HPLFVQTAPLVFVFIWSTGFIGARYGLPYAEPFTYLALRMVLAASLMAGFAVVRRAGWPTSWRQTGHIAISGLLLHAGYLGGVFFAISRGMPAGISALIVGLQPILTAVIATVLLREHVSARQWVGLVLGFAGVAIVVIERMRINEGGATSSAMAADIAILVALVSTTAGTIYQKQFNTRMPLASGTAIQYAVTAATVGLLAIATETMKIDWNIRFVLALSWQVIVLSLIAITLLMILIRQNSVSRLSSYLYLVPPLTAIEAYLLFDERLSLAAIGGMALVAIGVALVVLRRTAIP
ncbi:MAG TPA: EamA family transporter, partial [Mycobacterium sp.]|nr:EamA family transporter [Mycobacterium sp.]